MRFIALGIAHSPLGERFVLAWIFRMSGLPELSGSVWYVQRILRLAWHVTSVAWFGLAGIVFMLVRQPLGPRAVSVVVGVTSPVSFVLVLLVTRGRHIAAGVMFLIIGAVPLCYGAGIRQPGPAGVPYPSSASLQLPALAAGNP